jgi:NADPH-dependent glutamate synthase beta subunit-like oxidoreductase
MEKCEFYSDDKQPPKECGETVLVWGDHFGAADVAEKLAADGAKVHIVTENCDFAQWMEPCHRDVMMKRFAGANGEGLKSRSIQHPVEVIPNSTVVEISEGGQVTLLDTAFRKRTLSVDNLVLASVEPNDVLYSQLLEHGLNVMKIGDVKQVRNLRTPDLGGS